ncbi:protein FAM114A2-like [Musca vetustissima]|uniref:protein FAM114A2-like n=1 Tax=Musca vetustissima TaxID=27455 RepID=UPI002AB6C763|nr:protein FAM114A2-like [Musca vetustissima]
MSTKLESNANDSNENGWDLDDDDNWDDWGDAEENPTEDKVEETKTNSGSDQLQQQQCSKKTVAENNNTAPKVLQKGDTNCNQPQQRSQETVKQTSSAGGGGGGWGSLFGGVMSTVLSTATELTSTVTNSLDKVIGVPDPEEMARINASEEARLKSQQQQQQQQVKPNDDGNENDEEERSITPNKAVPVFGLNLVNNVTSLGSKVLNTGLDTLEGIGKKTMNILQENDPLLKNKIKKLGLEKEKCNLTEILKEAKKETEQLEQSMKELNLEKMKAQLRFEVLFENNCGLVHMEALEILSKESQLKIQTLKESVSGKALEELLETLNEVKELMELEDLDAELETEEYSAEELSDKLKEAIQDTELKIGFDEITNLWSTTLTWFASEESHSAEVQPIFAKAVTTLAETCALEILKLHKIAELLLIQEHHSTANEVDGVVQLCRQFNIHLQVVANRFASHLSNRESPQEQQEEAKTNITTIFTEMVQARQQIENAFRLFLPIIQIGAV